MSYPRKLHILIVEDDSDSIEAYRQYFAVLKKKYQLVDPFIVRSFSDAKQRIDGPEIFHIIILDMNLPMQTRGQAVEGLAPGEQLLEMIAKRDTHPVPVLLVVSGKLNLAQPIGNLPKRLDSDFWYGRMVNKGGLTEHQEFETAIIQALRYLDIGLHIRDSGKEWVPTLSPREKDLLRRCVLTQSTCLGTDLRWWSADSGRSVSQPSPNDGPTKVLMGRFILDEGLGHSIPTFFKFEPAGNGLTVCRDVGILSQKLGHVKVYHTSQSRQRSLVVTQSATNQGWPVSLKEYLQRDPKEVGPAVGNLVRQVADQLSQLGPEEQDEIVVGSFLCDFLDRAMIDKAWNNCDTRQIIKDGFPHPLTVFDTLKASKSKHWANRRNCTHGDLNATNIAIDASNPDDPQAYIFDAAGMRPDIEFRDMATLEVTSTLFNSAGIDPQLIQGVRHYYQSDFLPAPPAASATSVFAQNLFGAITAIRSRFQTDQLKTTYALLVFDAALRQLSGLGFQPSPNKVKNPLHACYLAAWAAKWLMTVAPQFFPQDSTQLEPVVERETIVA
jgi:CheY-like chemotaxis protein